MNEILEYHESIETEGGYTRIHLNEDRESVIVSFTAWKCPLTVMQHYTKDEIISLRNHLNVVIPLMKSKKEKEFEERENNAGKPFRDGQTRSQPCMSILLPLAVPVLRCEDARTTETSETTDDNMRSEEPLKD